MFRVPSRICLIFVAGIGLSLTNYAQNIHFSNMTENLYILNPSSITRIENLTFLINYRNQWPGTSSYNTYSGTFLYHSEQLRSTAGILIMRDTQGNSIINLTSLGILYGYQARIARTWFLSGGIFASYNLYNTNFNNLVFENGQIPPTISDNNRQYFDFASGLELSYRDNARYGFSISRLGSFQPAFNNLPGIQFNLSYQGKYVISKGYREITKIIEPLFNIAVLRSSNEILYGSRVNIGGIVGGLYLRQNIMFEMDAFIILLGTHIGNLSFYYCYDINLSGADSRFSKLAAHEVTFLYDMQYKRKRIKKRAIKCPKI